VARPNNLLTQAAKWRAADVSANTGGDMDAALGRITAAATLAREAFDRKRPWP
jgi:hypothetical protein